MIRQCFKYKLGILHTNEPAHDKAYNRTCVISKDSDQPVHPTSMARVLVCPSLVIPEDVEGTCDQRRLRSACASAQSDQSLRWSHKSYCRFYRKLVHFSTEPCTIIVGTH